MFDPIEPPAARRPDEALELVSQALSDGDLEAALAQYEKDALLAAWPGGDGDVGQVLTWVMALRLPLYVQITRVLEGPGVALVLCARRISGTGPDGERVWFAGHGCAVLRPQPDGAWRIAADAWRIAADVWSTSTELPPEPPVIPPGVAGDAVPREGRGGPPHH
jgi:ketosteroid isomerase-like protein